jgi:hypothetical protein
MPTYPNRPENPIASIQQTVSSTALPVTPASALAHGSGLDANMMVVNVITDAIRYRTDGGTPTAVLGIQVPAGGTITLNGIVTLRNFRMIRVTADAQVNIETFLT